MARGEPLIRIRLPIELKVRLQNEALANGRSMNSEVIQVLKRAYGTSTITRKPKINPTKTIKAA